MPKNHFLSQGYLRGFSTKTDNYGYYLEEMDADGIMLTKSTAEVSFEEGEEEPSIELIRKKVESWWGTYRTNIRTDLHLSSNRGQRENVAEFLANSIFLSDVGRMVVRADTTNAFNSKEALEAIKIGITSGAIKDRFLELNWMIVKPIFPFFTGDNPAVLRLNDDDPSRISAMFYPLTTEYLLCLSENTENTGYKDQDALASTCGIDYMAALMDGAAAQRAKLYAPLGYPWDKATDIVDRYRRNL